MSRALVIVLDSFGVGAAHDAAAFGDAGADTLGHIAAACAAGRADRAGLRAGPLHIPHLERLGLGALHAASTGAWAPGLARREGFAGAHGYGVESSAGKDTPSGHWELMGLPVPYAWHLFPPGPPAFPQGLLDSLVREAGLPGVLGNCAASGTEIVERLGAESVASGKPIVYTSGDSVFQVAAHEQAFGLERLYATCAIARRLVDPLRVGRVIARPFVGTPGAFRRTTHRHDWTTPPHADTLLDRLVAAGGHVTAIGKIDDIFAHRGTSEHVAAGGNDEVLDATCAAWARARPRSLVFANCVDFDTLYGHRRDVAGYAAALEAFDRRLPQLEALLGAGDLALLSADHGCDPTYRGTDHTREHVPLLAFGPAAPRGALGRRAMADAGATLAEHLGLAPLAAGTSFLRHGR
ncbi:MAG: phosphopentomutase [Planctomycetia bacterium]